MKKSISIASLLCMLIFPLVSIAQTYHSVIEVYTDTTIQTGDTLWVAAYYTNPDNNFLIEFYGDWDLDQVMAPHTYMVVEGMAVPQNAWNGGYVVAKGTIRYVANPDPYYPEDSLIAYLNMFDINVLIDGEQAIDFKSPGKDEKGDNGYRGNSNGCDSCKFAVLISGGVNAANNHSKYWENLVALYNFKVDSMGYCKDNVFVHYYDGVRRDNRIPQDQVLKADSAKISDSFVEVSKRVAKCNRENKKATFQKMVTNHGAANGDINLLNNNVLKPANLRDMQQRIIDSCCSLVYDEFLQCYGGYSVDTMSTLDAKNKATIYANSNADHQSGHSPHNKVHPYLDKKINALDEGQDYEDAVVAGKLGYDSYLQQRINVAHTNAQHFRNNPELPNAAANLAYWVADSTTRANKICTSRNVVITPMKQYCQWKKFVVPPGGQLILKFKGDNIKSCGNVTVYLEDPTTKNKKKVKVWNWNIKDSFRYTNGNEQRVINGVTNSSTTFWVHNDNSEYVITAEVTGNTDLAESASNIIEFPGFSFGGSDMYGYEFGEIFEPFYYYDSIDVLDLHLYDLPAYMGPEEVMEFEFTFDINQSDEFWTDMELYIEVAWVFYPDTLFIFSEMAQYPMVLLPISEPGVFTAHLGDMTQGGTRGQIMMRSPFCTFEFDCWGLRSLYDPPVGLNEPVSMETVHNNYLKVSPNPFDQGVFIEFILPKDGRVNLSLHDILGKEIVVLYDGQMNEGKERFYFDGKDSNGQSLPRGVYFVRLALNGQYLGVAKIIKHR